jgi:major membrane immunogen (membrane-anchored lipoprotein)
VLDTITGEQSLEVDTVTGATFSSAGLINAVADALQGAVTSGTLQVTDIDLSSVSRRGH